jgi:hypothetical protein
MTKWLDGPGGQVGDSAVAEVGGRVGIGTTNPGGQLHIYGVQNTDVFAGMGPDVVNGPGFNYGYAGGSFGVGAGFFNVRPAMGATGVNPSLRFMTVDQQRMIITNAGNIGIGTSAPTQKLDVVGDINSATGYDIGNQRVLGIPGTNNLFAGVNAGSSISSGYDNSFVGASAGGLNSSGAANSFFGYAAGYSNVSSSSNSFFGHGAGFHAIGGLNSYFGESAGSGSLTSTGTENAAFGFSAGAQIAGNSNAFFGARSGGSTTTGGSNVFVGYASGQLNTTGSNNVIIGVSAGGSNTAENNNTFIGSSANGGTAITNATALGANATVGQSNSLVLGSINGLNGASADTKVGIGTRAPNARLHVAGGDAAITSQGSGVILRATDGANCYRVTVNNVGVLSTAVVTCP